MGTAMATGEKPMVIAPSLPAALSGTAGDCAALPGAIVHDDGTYEGGFGGDFISVTSTAFVDKFMPRVYPATFSTACISLSQDGPALQNFNFNVVVYADDGESGAPGTLLGSVPVTAATLPASGFAVPGEFIPVDLSSLNLNIPSGSVYIGVQWDATQYPGHYVFVDSDGTSGGPFAGGYSRNNFSAGWQSLYDQFHQTEYRSLLVRAVDRALHPTLALAAEGAVLIDHCAVNPAYGNGVVEPGETIDVMVPVFASSGSFTGVSASLITPAPTGVQYLAAQAAVGDVADGAHAEAHFQIKLDSTSTCMQNIELPIALASDQGDFSGQIEIPVGQPLADIAPRGLPFKIADGDPAGTSSTIHIAQSAVLSDLVISVDADPYEIDQIGMTLTSPAGTTITLFDRPGIPGPGCENSDVHVLFADGSPDPEETCDPNAGYSWPVSDAGPAQPFSTFAGENMQGVWTLTVNDAQLNNSGAILAWAMYPTPALGDVCRPCQTGDAIFADGFDSVFPEIHSNQN
jgi:hypothetical protein